jgi:hypothetical protein
MKQNMTPISTDSLAYLSQIAESISQLSGTRAEQRTYAEDLYQRGLAMMLAAAPSPFQREWNRIQIARVRIGGEHIKQLAYEPSTGTGDELTSEEEKLYQEAIDS